MISKISHMRKDQDVFTDEQMKNDETSFQKDTIVSNKISPNSYCQGESQHTIIYSSLCFFQVADVLRETKDGFTKGQLMIEGVGDCYQNDEIIVHFQNEYLVVKRKTQGNIKTSPSSADVVS